jgi:hypothetical protein
MMTLKCRNFVAAVNTEIVSQHNNGKRGKISFGNLLEVAIMSYANFPLFTRRDCHSSLLNYALDFFLGKACFLVAHHNYFQSGFEPLKKLVAQLNHLAPGLRWTTIGRVLDENYVWRSVSEGVCEVRLYANQAVLRNDQPVSRTFKVLKPEQDPSVVTAIFVNEMPVSFDWDGRFLRFSCSLEAGAQAQVRLSYVEPECAPRNARRLSYRVKCAARRYMSEIRDDYLQPLRHRLLATLG